MMERLSQFTSETQRGEIESVLRPWLEPYCIDLEYAVAEILDANRGPMPFVKALLRNAVFNNADEAFNYFRQGFVGEGERTSFTSVYHLRRLLI